MTTMPQFSSSPILCSSAVLLSVLLLLLLLCLSPTRRRQSPIPLQDELDDLHLFHQALLSSSYSHTFSRPSLFAAAHPKPKIAFLFLTNSDLVFAPLWDRFFRGHHRLFNVYVHADPDSKFGIPDWSVQANFIPAKKTHRSSATLISAARRLIAHALIDDPFNLYFALVSQHCIPLHSFPYMYESLFGGPITAAAGSFLSQQFHPSFIEILSRDRHLQQRYVARGETVMLPEVPRDRFRVGSQFFILAKRHALLVIKERRLWRKFRLPCLDSEVCYPEEHYFPTYLEMADPGGCTHFTLTRVNWTQSVGGHPHTYRPPEISPRLIRTLRESNSSFSHFFARKFSPECLDPLMGLADDVSFRDR